MIFDQIHIDHIRFKRLFDSGVWLCRAQVVWRFTETDLGNFGPWTFGSSHFVPILRTFRPLLSQCSPVVRSFGSLDYSTVLLKRKHGRVSFDNIIFALVWFLFYGPSTHFRSFRTGSVNLATLFLGKPPRQFTST